MEANADMRAGEAILFQSSPSVSVAMCTYNGSRFIRRQLESIAQQSQLPDELVVCDDRSQDNTIELLEAFASTAEFPVRLHRNAETLRPAQNFSKCLSLCKGDVVILTDQDDVWFHDRIVRTSNAFATDAGLTFTFSDSPLIDQDERNLGRTIYSTVPIPAADRRELERGTSLLPVLLRWGVLYGTTMAVRGSLHSSYLPVPKLWSHDEWLALSLSALGHSKRQEPVTQYRQHAGQQVGTGNWTLGTHVGLAHSHTAGHYESELMRCIEALAIIATKEEFAQTLRPLLEAKADFLRKRRRVQAGTFREFPMLIQLVQQGEYARYASAIKSPVKDLIMLFSRKTSGASMI